jgi:hypothetical protein
MAPFHYLGEDLYSTSTWDSEREVIFQVPFSLVSVNKGTYYILTFTVEVPR